MSTTATEVESKVREELAELADIDQDLIVRDATWEALDVDSLDLAELGQVIEETYGVQLKGSDVAELKTVGDLVDLVSSRAA